MYFRNIFILGLFFFLIVSPLIAGTVTNEGPSAVRLSVKYKNGYGGNGMLPPGKTVPLRNDLMWLKHIPEDPKQEVRIKIVEDNGSTNYLTTKGGLYNRS